MLNTADFKVNENTASLVNICIDQACTLLLEAGEYYPFAFGIDQNGKIVPVATYFEEEHPSSTDVISYLKKALTVSNERHNFTEVAICAHVDLVDNLVKDVKSAIEVSIDSLQNSNFNFYQPYLLGDPIKFGNPEIRQGTLCFFLHRPHQGLLFRSK